MSRCIREISDKLERFKPFTRYLIVPEEKELSVLQQALYLPNFTIFNRM